MGKNRIGFEPRPVSKKKKQNHFYSTGREMKISVRSGPVHGIRSCGWCLTSHRLWWLRAWENMEMVNLETNILTLKKNEVLHANLTEQAKKNRI